MNNSEQSLSGIADHPLPKELITGHAVIDQEHRLLLGCIRRLREICDDHDAARVSCAGCNPGLVADCESRLVGILGDLLAFILDHFRNEEHIMRDSLLLAIERETCEAHMEDHAAISSKVLEIVANLETPKTIQRLRELEELLLRWVTNHVSLHDMLLVRWLEREDSPIRLRALAPA